MKTTMKLDVLKCHAVKGVLLELQMFALVYNLVRQVIIEGVSPNGAADQVNHNDTTGTTKIVGWALPTKTPPVMLATEGTETTERIPGRGS